METTKDQVGDFVDDVSHGNAFAVAGSMVSRRLLFQDLLPERYDQVLAGNFVKIKKTYGKMAFRDRFHVISKPV